MHKATKYLDKGITLAAGAAWNTVQFFNQFKPNNSFTPKWTDKPLLKSYQKTKPPLGWPRTTDSLCPTCVREARERILSGEQDWQTLTTDHVGETRSKYTLPLLLPMRTAVSWHSPSYSARPARTPTASVTACAFGAALCSA